MFQTSFNFFSIFCSFNSIVFNVTYVCFFSTPGNRIKMWDWIQGDIFETYEFALSKWTGVSYN